MNLDSIRQQLRARMPDVVGTLRAKAVEHDAPAREAGYTIRAEADTSIVRIYDEIWWLGVNALDLARDLDAIATPKIRVEINSPGGDVFDGIAIYNALRAHPAEVTTRVDGIAASIASVIAQAGDRRVMLTGSQMMIHNAWGVTMGDNRDHTEMASVLEQQDAVIAGIYAARSGADVESFRDLMNSESWLTAERAVELGLADEVVDPSASVEQPVAAKADMAERIHLVAATGDEVISDVERLVADHGDAGPDLTGRKRDGLVALRDLGARADDLLTRSDTHDDTDVIEIEARRIAAARRDLEFRSAI